MRSYHRFIWGVMGVMLFALSALSQDRLTVPAKLVSYPTMIIYNGKIMTMDDESTTLRVGTVVQAMAVRGKEIFAIGSDAEILELAGPNTERIDLKGRTVIPGIIDSHTHIHNGEVNYWISQHPEILEKYSRQFTIPGRTNEEIYKGIEIVLKENMASAPPGQWAFLQLNTNEGGSGMGQGVKFVQDHAMELADLNQLAPKNPVFMAAHPAYMINDAARKAIRDLYGFEPLVGVGEEMDENQQGGLVLYGRGLIVDWEVEPGRTVKAWTYNGMVPAPTIKVDVGDKVRVVLKNELPMGTDIHWHGVRVPNDQDGVAPITQELIKAGATYTYEFQVTEPIVAMYHPHHHAQMQVVNGMLGMFQAGSLPLPAGRTIAGRSVPAGLVPAQEFPMVLNDAGPIGFSLNGKSFPATDPYVQKVGDWVLIHYFNEGLQIHPMHPHQFPQLVFAKDGIPLDSPYWADTLNVAPGERYSVLMHLDREGVWVWHCHILNHVEREKGMFGMVTAFVVQP